MIIRTKYSRNFSKKTRKKKDIKIIVIHYTGMQSRIVSIRRLLSSRDKVSCHYLIDRKGRILKMVDENKVAWHAGKSKWKNFNNLNKNSIGIELVNKGHEFGYEKFTSEQINQLIRLCLNLKRKYKIKNSNILGHSDIAPLRKQDPGEKFPWKKLKRNQLGIWYKNLKSRSNKISDKKVEKSFFKNLFKIGYRYFDKNKRTRKDSFIVKAFQRRFLPNEVTGVISEKTYIISHFLANHLKN
jgi:N-acetylmuramoyl-L-alanine amidase